MARNKNKQHHCQQQRQSINKEISTADKLRSYVLFQSVSAQTYKGGKNSSGHVQHSDIWHLSKCVKPVKGLIWDSNSIWESNSLCGNSSDLTSYYRLNFEFIREDELLDSLVNNKPLPFVKYDHNGRLRTIVKDISQNLCKHCIAFTLGDQRKAVGKEISK